MLQPPPLAPSPSPPFSLIGVGLLPLKPSVSHTLSLLRVPFALSDRSVPPTATTSPNEAGKFGASAAANWSQL